jgi:hypothetical protein
VVGDAGSVQEDTSGRLSGGDVAIGSDVAKKNTERGGASIIHHQPLIDSSEFCPELREEACV